MDNLDDFIKGKLDQAPIEFNEAHWMQATQLIDQQAAGQRRRLLAWSFLCQIVVFALLAMFIAVDNPNFDGSAFDAFASDDLQLESTVQELQSEITTKNAESKGTSENHQLESNPTTNSTEDLSNNSNSNHQTQATQINSNSSNNKSQQQTGNAILESSNKNDTQLQTLIQKQERVGVEPPSIANHSIQNQPKGEESNKVKINDDSKSNTNTPIVLNSTQEEIALHSSEIALNPNETESQNDPNKIIVEAQMLGIAQYLTNELKLLENNLPTDINKTPELHDENRPFRSAISLYAASTMYPYTQVGAKKLLGYTAGANYTLNIKKAWSIDLGLHYRVREGSFANTQTTQQDSFSFGRIQTEHALKANQLHTLEFPLAVSYNKKRHQILLGVNYARLLGLKGSLNKIDDPENVATSTIVDKGWFDDTQFKTNRFDVIAGYYFTLKPGLRLGANVHFALGGFQNKETPTDLYLESKPLFIDFGIRYDLLNR